MPRALGIEINLGRGANVGDLGVRALGLEVPLYSSKQNYLDFSFKIP